MQRNLKEFGEFSDAKAFIAERTKFISSSNQKLSDLHAEVKSGLLIMPEGSDDEIILDRFLLTALVFHDEKDRTAYENGTFINFGKYHIDTVEIYYGEYIRPGEMVAISWTKLNLRGKQPGRVPSDFCKTNHFWNWNDEKLAWGKNCFFAYHEEYFLFKEKILQLGKEFGVIKDSEQE